MSTGIDFKDLQRRMEGAISAFKHDLASLRTGRASANLLDPIQVQAYGAPMPINQVATVTVPLDPSSLVPLVNCTDPPAAALPLRSRFRREPAVRRCDSQSSAARRRREPVVHLKCSPNQNDGRHATRPQVHLLRL